MLFDKSRVFTGLNADELKVGSKVIVADSLGMLRTRVENLKIKEDEKSLITTIREIKDENYRHRFVEQDNVFWNFVYLISEPEEKELKWTDLKLGDKIVSKDRTCQRIVTGINVKGGSHGNTHIQAGASFLADKEISNWEIFRPFEGSKTDKVQPSKGIVHKNRYKLVNLNEHIKVKLTETGKEVFRKYYNNIPYSLHIDDDGYAEFQLWDFMHIFGSDMRMAGPLVCETNVFIETQED